MRWIGWTFEEWRDTLTPFHGITACCLLLSYSGVAAGVVCCLLVLLLLLLLSAPIGVAGVGAADVVLLLYFWGLVPSSYLVRPPSVGSFLGTQHPTS